MKGMILCVVLLSCFCFAEQFLLWDGDHTLDGSSGAYRADWEGPANWNSPVNYYGCTMYTRIEVISKPTDLYVGQQYCNWNKNESCSVKGNVTFRSAGVFAGSTSPSTFWTKTSSISSWKDFHKNFKYVFKAKSDGMAGKWIQSSNKSHTAGPGIMEHLPIKMHITSIAVSAGTNEVVVPEQFDWPCPSEWDNCEGEATVANRKTPARNALPVSLITVKRSAAVMTPEIDGLLTATDLSGARMFSIVVTAGQQVLLGGGLKSGVYLITFAGTAGVQSGRVMVW